MTHNGFAKGIALGAVAGAVLGVIVTPKSRDAKRSAAKFLRTATNVIEDVSSIWR